MFNRGAKILIELFIKYLVLHLTNTDLIFLSPNSYISHLVEHLVVCLHIIAFLHWNVNNIANLMTNNVIANLMSNNGNSVMIQEFSTFER